MSVHNGVNTVCVLCFLLVVISLTALSLPPPSVLKGYTVQHLPDGTVMVESIVLKVSSSSEDPNLKVILLSWSYQVTEGARLQPKQCSSGKWWASLLTTESLHCNHSPRPVTYTHFPSNAKSRTFEQICLFSLALNLQGKCFEQIMKSLGLLLPRIKKRQCLKLL